MKPKVLIFVGYYSPSVKAGGPVQSIKNIVSNLSEYYDFYIVTSDRDLGDDCSFKDIETEKWIRESNINIFYTNRNELNMLKLRKIIRDINFDVLYLNSFFSIKFSIQIMLMKKIGLLKKGKTIIAPRGEFSKGALSLKSSKKNIYIKISKLFNLYNSVTWQATTKNEQNDITKVFGSSMEIKIANNLTENYNKLIFDKNIVKNVGELKLLFISRIHPTKNLKTALEVLLNVSGKVLFSIYGPVEDKEYWEECKEIIKKFKVNISVKWYGPIKHEEIMWQMKRNHILILPTLGENFGHVISEALIGGCPVIISNQTPWRNLEDKGIGWDLSLKNNSEFIAAIQYCVNLDQKEYDDLSANAFYYSKENSNTPQSIESYHKLFSSET